MEPIYGTKYVVLDSAAVARDAERAARGARPPGGGAFAMPEANRFIPERSRLVLRPALGARALAGLGQSEDLSPLGPSDPWQVGSTRDDRQRDVVDMATSLVRITHNQAAVHRDVEVSPYDVRLVYGGHTVALAQASLARVLGGLATVVGWHACSHTAPVFEGDILSSHHTLVAEREVAGGRLRAVEIEVLAHRPGADPVSVLAWTPVVLTT